MRILSAVLASLLLTVPAFSDDLDWERRRFSQPEYGILGGMALTLPLLFLMVDSQDPALFTTGWLFDDPVREAIGLEAFEERETAKLVADILYIGMLFYPVVGDSLLVTGLARESTDAAYQMAAIDLQAQVFAGLIAIATEKLVGRERPAGRGCRENPERDPDCKLGVKNLSFLAGHVAMSTTSAGLVCVHHLELGLFGDRAADVAACAVGVTIATTVAVLRIVSDSHYATDVIAGATLGVLAGVVLPMLLHYSEPARTSGEQMNGLRFGLVF